jgi:DNA-binding winged helix-turn-helix (wHTH) protein
MGGNWIESWARIFSDLKSLESLPDADGERVSKDELIDKIWAGVAVQENNSKPRCLRAAPALP